MPVRLSRISTFVQGQTRRSGIPTGFCLKAQGCEERATLGYRPQTSPTPKAFGVAAIPFTRARDLGHNAVGVVSDTEHAPKVAPTNRGNLGLKDTIPLGLSNQAIA